MVQRVRALAHSDRFQHTVTAVIIFAGLLVGVETYGEVVASYGDLLHVFDAVVMTFFVAEIVLKLTAESPKPWRYFRDPWNVFDFVIVAAAFLPFAASYATVLRLMRLLRVLKLVKALPKLQMLVAALLKSIPSMVYVSLLLFLLFYVYAVAGVYLWGANDPHHFGSLQMAFVSLFRAATLEDWTDLMYIQMYGCANYGYDGMAQLCTQSSATPVGGALYFVSFVLLGTMIVLNLFIGVILSGMDEAHEEANLARRLEQRAKETNPPTMGDQLGDLVRELSEMQTKLAELQREADMAARPRRPRSVAPTAAE